MTRHDFVGLQRRAGLSHRLEFGRNLWTKLHRYIGLFLGALFVLVGLVGIPAIFLLVSVVVGLYLWWPSNGNWRHALTIKWGATQVRLTYDVHKTVGRYLAAVLIILLFSGIYIIFEPQVREVVRYCPQCGKSRLI